MKAGIIAPKPSYLPLEVQNKVRELYKSGMSLREVGVELNISRFNVEKVLGFKMRAHSDSNHMVGVRKSKELTDQQKQLLLGSLLGDASISPNDNRGYYVRETHGPKQDGYAQYKSQILGGGKVHRYLVKSSKMVSVSDNYYASTYVFKNAKASKYLEPLVLVDGKKKVNERWTKELTREGVAYWFMDDGSSSYNGNTSCVNLAFHTNGFLLEEVQLLNDMMLRFGYETTIQSSPSVHGNGNIITMKQSTIDQFISDMTPYVWPIECMRYKLKTKEMASNRKTP